MDRRLGTVAVVLLLVGVAASATGAYLIYQQEQSLSDVESANGTVVSVGVDETRENGSTAYYPNVTYRYTVDGTTYTARDLYPPPGEERPRSRERAEEIAGEFSRGEGVTVYYRTDDPARATLRQNRNPGPYMAMWLGAVGVLFGILFGAGAIQRDDDGDRADLDDEVRLG